MKAATMRIAVSSSPFRRPLASGELTQLEWVERCATLLGVDGVLPLADHFPRHDAEYIAQLRKVAIDLALVPFGIDAPGLLDAGAEPEMRERVLALADAFGAAVIRTDLPDPGEVPPATFIETGATAKALSRAAKALNVTAIVGARPEAGRDAAEVKHLLKDVDSAWLRAAPAALAADQPGAKERIPAFVATAGDDPRTVVARAYRSWLILDAAAVDEPWAPLAAAIAALRAAEAHGRA